MKTKMNPFYNIHHFTGETGVWRLGLLGFITADTQVPLSRPIFAVRPEHLVRFKVYDSGSISIS